jgi:GWxTD domain-containing protein
MRTPSRWVLLAVSSAILLAPGLWAQNPPAGTDQSNKDKNGQAQQVPPKRLTKAQQKKAMNELGNVYKGWLENEVPYIITDAEREAFLSLTTNEDRESFIEQFWLRRNPNPDTIENEFKEEHYRRIAYANEHYASGIPGWKTDRGHIYILWGKPDSTDTHPSGGTYNRTPEEGGGETSTYPFEVWTYHYLEGIGPNIELEFVDVSGSNEYHLSSDPEEKDALLYVPGAGLSDLEAMGMADKTQRFNRPDGTHMPIGSNYAPGNDEFSRYELLAKVFVPPPAKSKDLEALVSARIVRNQLPFDYNFAFLRITTESVMVPITIELPNREMTFQEKDGVHSAKLNLYARITTPSGRVVQTFEDVLPKDFPDSLFQQYLTKKSIYGKTIPLRPGLYKIDIVLKDVQSGNVGVVSTRLAVPRFDEEKMDAGTLILADDIQHVAPNQVGIGQFVLGDVKVRPALKQEFTSDQKMGIFFQVYNLKVDDTNHKSNVVARFHITKGDQTVLDATETSAEFKQTGDELTIETMVPLSAFQPGKYKLEITINDLVAKQTLTRAQEFTVFAPVQQRAAAN